MFKDVVSKLLKKILIEIEWYLKKLLKLIWEILVIVYKETKKFLLWVYHSQNWNFVFKKTFNNIIDILKYFSKKYIYSVNHRIIAINYLYFSMLSGLSGLSLATMIRIELSTPGSYFFKGDSIKYLQIITAHGLIMIFFVVVPLIFGFLANYFIPYHIGSKDVAFPRINSFGFWILIAGYILILRIGFFRRQMFNYYDSYDITSNIFKNFYNKYNILKKIKYKKIDNTRFSKKKIKIRQTDSLISDSDLESFFTQLSLRYKKINNMYIRYLSFNMLYSDNISPQTFVVQCTNSGYTISGWTFITPFSSKLKYTGFGAQDIAVIGVIFAGLTTTLSFTNLLVTRRTLSSVGIKNKKSLIPFLSISLFLTMRMLALITPVLGGAMIMLQLDRHWNTSFFDYTYGGDPILFHHLFWFFGHPEVYVVIIPMFGVVNMILPNYNFRRVASKNHLIWATYIMAYMGFLVWGHHMYLIGLDHRARSFYSTITIMISLPAVVKIVNWTLTTLNGYTKINTSYLFAFSFISFFLSGGLTGMWLSHVGLNIFVHDTYYVVAHFHFMFSASTFSGIFCAIYFYFDSIFGITYSKIYSYMHWIYWTVGQWITFMPLYYVGYNGLPRRYHDYPSIYEGWQNLASAGHLLNIFSLFFFFIMLYDSHYKNKPEIPSHLNCPRFNKRIIYYIYKINRIQNKHSKSLISYDTWKIIYKI